MSKKQPVMLTIDAAVYYKRLAWLMRNGAYQEANALRELAQWFDPPFRVDERRIEQEIARQNDAAERIHDPTQWA